MNIIELTKVVGHVAMSQPNINSFYEGDVYDILDNKEVKYSSIIISISNASKVGNSTVVGATLYYIDRLLEDSSNKQSIYDDAVNYLGVILSTITKNFQPIQIDDYNVNLFYQSFTDLCAGGYADLQITLPASVNNCGWDANFKPIWETKKLNINENGSYVVEADDGTFLERVVIDANVLDQKVIVDDHLDANSINPVQNKVITKEIAKIPTKTSQLRNDSGYINKVANYNELGGVKPVAKTNDMNLPVGIDELGQLYTIDKTNPTSNLNISDSYYDITSAIDKGDEIWAVYKFDDEYYYVMSPRCIYKLTNTFELVYRLPFYNMVNRYEAGSDRNHLAKLGNKLFIARCYGTSVLYMLNETDMKLTQLDTKGVSYYGSVYSVGDKVLYAHRYQSNDIFVYNAEGVLLKRVSSAHQYLRVTDGIIWCKDGYTFNIDALDFNPDPIKTPYSLSNGWLFSNGNAVMYNAYGWAVMDYQGKYPDTGHSYTWNNLTRSSVALFALNITNSFVMTVWGGDGVYQLRYPYGPTNPVGRRYTFDCGMNSYYGGGIRQVSNYKNVILSCQSGNIIHIDNAKRYGVNLV